MNKIRARLKVLLANTFMYDFAKRVHGWIKIGRDKRLFLLRHPTAEYIHYSFAELVDQKNQGFRSQYGQDYFLWTRFLARHSPGMFVDIGANTPVVNNNSWYLEQQGWNGLAIDPIKHFQPLWLEQRKSPLLCGAVSDTEGEVDFVEIQPDRGWEHALSGFKSHVRDEDMKIYQYKEYRVITKPLSAYVPEPEKVGVMLIDVEGAEMQVLKGIDFTLFPRLMF